MTAYIWVKQQRVGDLLMRFNKPRRLLTFLSTIYVNLLRRVVITVVIAINTDANAATAFSFQPQAGRAGR